MSLADVWFALLGFILFLALASDGWDLGIGILSLFCRHEGRREIMLNSIGPSWHANLTWLVILGGLLFGAFPLAYSVILSALYIPLVLMLWGLIFRGVSLDFRGEARNRRLWNLGSGLGSLLTALAQGFILGALVSGLRVEGRAFAGGVWDWLNPLAALVALGVLFAYLLLGATYLILKSGGEVQETAYRQAQVAAWSLLIVSFGLGFWGIYKYPFLSRNWLVSPSAWLTTFPVIVAAFAFVMLLASLLKADDRAPFTWSLAIFFCSFLAMAASLHPYIIPPAITVSEAGAPPLILAVMLAVTLVILPVMLIYNGYQYLVFGGKTSGEGGGYGA
ncbi:MAG: cytochrome d ubiquinol oxidase subunit II [Deltaproteobacteria bacterium]|nr:cytochrome d ubiquinol oxidase subunit II [Deltaproteobacteria bacterium]